MTTHNTPPKGGGTTRVSQVIKAPRHAVYAAFLDANSLAAWLAPDTMTGEVHILEPHVGGKIHMSLSYPTLEDTPNGRGGKSSDHVDTFHGTFDELVLNEKIVWLTEFESPDPAFAGEMKLTWTFEDVQGGTQVTVLCENIPQGIRPEDNEAGSRSSLEKLASFLER